MEIDWNDLESVAQRLLGSELVRQLNGQTLRGRIVEVEAYHQSDAASHSYNGRTTRNEVMFGPPGHLYVYFTYGMHYCMNIVTGGEGEASAVLIRALQPLEGIEQMRLNRSGRSDSELTNGPAKACQALSIDKAMNGHDLTKPPLKLELKPPINSGQVVTAKRIGISKERDKPWRWYIAGNQFVSKRS